MCLESWPSAIGDVSDPINSVSDWKTNLVHSEAPWVYNGANLGDQNENAGWNAIDRTRFAACDRSGLAKFRRQRSKGESAYAEIDSNRFRVGALELLLGRIE